jgi:hypothetical protein
MDPLLNLSPLTPKPVGQGEAIGGPRVPGQDAPIFNDLLRMALRETKSAIEAIREAKHEASSARAMLEASSAIMAATRPTINPKKEP